MSVNNLLGAPGLALFQRLADADDRRDDRRMGSVEFRRHAGIALAVELAPLGMTDDRVPAARVLDHGRGDFAGVRPLRVLAYVLSAPRDLGSREERRHLFEVRIGRTDRDLHRALP